MGSRVLLVSHGFQPSYEKAFTNALAHHGLEVTLAASVRTEFEHLDPAVKVVNLLPSMDPSRTIAQKIIAKISYVYGLSRLVLENRYRTIHLVGIFLTTSIPLGVLELLFYRLASRRLLMTVHNLLPHGRHTSLNFRVAWLAYRIPHMLVVHTEKMRDELNRNWGIATGRIIVMEHGVDAIPSATATWHSDENGKIRLLMFGSVARYKGVDIALAALDRCHDFQVDLKIVGACRDVKFEMELRELAGRIPDFHHIEWINGYVPEVDVQAYFEAADAVLLPYRHIDQSGVLFTAFRFGTPVIAFDVGAFAHYVKPNVGIVVKEQNAAGLLDGMRTFQKNIANYDRSAIKKHAEQYLWENTVHPILSQYR